MKKLVYSAIVITLIASFACTKKTTGERKNRTEAKKPLTIENFTVAETDKYFTEFANKYPVNTFNHSRKMSGKNSQFVIRENQDTYYSNALVDISKGATLINPPWDVYSSIQVIDEHHYTIAVLYSGDTLAITKDMVELGDHVYLNVRTGVRSLDSAALAEAHKHQDSYVIQANASKPYISKGFDQPSLDSVRKVVLAKSVNVKPWRAFGKKEETDSLDFLLASAAGWGGLPAKHATYVSSIQPSGKALDGECSSITLPVPPLQFEKGGFFSLTTYGPDGYIATEKFALNNLQAKANPDGTYTFHFNCKGAKNNIDVVKNWNMIIRLYMPNSLDSILTYIERLNREAKVTLVKK